MLVRNGSSLGRFTVSSTLEGGREGGREGEKGEGKKDETVIAGAGDSLYCGYSWVNILWL